MKALLLVEKVKDTERVEPVLKFNNIEFKKHGVTMYDIWATEQQIRYLNTFDYISVIRVA